MAKFPIAQEAKAPRQGGEANRYRGARRPVSRGMEAPGKGVDREKLHFEAEENPKSDVRFRDCEEFIRPRELHQDGAGGREQDEIIPAFAQGDGGDADVQHRDVPEERRRIIHAGREQHRCKETAKQAEDDDHLGVHADGEEERGGRNDGHGSERGNKVDEVIENVRRENVAVEHEHAGGAETLARDAVTP